MNQNYTETDCYGITYYCSDSDKTILHREDGPAIEFPNGAEEWYCQGKRHREDGPAIDHPDWKKEWYHNGKPHREDGPAIEWADGVKEWYLNGKLHREDGPAVEYPDDYKSWYERQAASQRWTCRRVCRRLQIGRAHV